VENKLKRQIIDEEYEDYYFMYNDYFGCQLNFQVTFGDSGGQDWLVSKRFD